MKSKWKQVLILIVLALTVGVGAGYVISKEQTIRELQQELNDTREQLYISNDTLKQIYMHDEREYYMNQMKEEVEE